MGMYNDTIVASETMADDNTPLFIVGNGKSISDRSNAMVVFKSGTVAIATNTPGAFKLEVNGDAGKPGGGSWSANSDIRLKQDLHNYDDGLAEILRICPVRFRYNEKSGYATDKEYIGVIAQELQPISPYMMSTFEKDGEEYLKVDNSAMIYMLINTVQTLSEQNDVLSQSLEAQKEEIAELKSFLTRITESTSQDHQSDVK